MTEKGKDIVRIFGTDIPGNMPVYPGLTKIKGVSWTFSNALCYLLKLDKKKKIGTLSDAEIKKVMDFIKNPKLPKWLLNRRNDVETGEASHLITTDLDLKKEFDIRRLKKIKSYKGYRHWLGRPVRGQRTRSHFRSKKKARTIGVKKPKTSSKK
ncbi:MAG: 30S ribosomal protein S13 [archaeon]|nr:MAG: 30S ribosomal protein S13 [archaeon]